jgi:PhoH-like ATPase
MHLAQDGQEVTVVSKDLPCASRPPLSASTPRSISRSRRSTAAGRASPTCLSGDDISDLYEAEVATSDEVRGFP